MDIAVVGGRRQSNCGNVFIRSEGKFFLPRKL